MGGVSLAKRGNRNGPSEERMSVRSRTGHFNREARISSVTFPCFSEFCQARERLYQRAGGTSKRGGSAPRAKPRVMPWTMTRLRQTDRGDERGSRAATGPASRVENVGGLPPDFAPLPLHGHDVSGDLPTGKGLPEADVSLGGGGFPPGWHGQSTGTCRPRQRGPSFS